MPKQAGGNRIGGTDRKDSSGTDEKDAIGQINRQKRQKRQEFAKGNDAKSSEEKESSEGNIDSKPTGIPSSFSGNDSETSTPPAASASSLTDATNQPQPIRQQDLPEGQFIFSKTELDAIGEQSRRRAEQDYGIKLKQTQAEYQEKLDELERQRERDRADREALEKTLAAEKSRAATLANVFTDFGYAPPEEGGFARDAFIAPQSTRGGMSSRDAFREYTNIYENIVIKDARSIISNRSGMKYIQRDTAILDKFYQENRDALRQAMNDVASKAGVFQGSSGAYNKDAPTTFENFPPALREYLSQTIRTEHSASFVLWQAVNRTIRVGVPPEQTTDIPRVRHLAGGTTSQDWQLTPGVKTLDDRQNLQGGNISLRIGEYGTGTGVAPVGLSELVQKTNILDIEKLLRDRLGYNYYQWEDLKVLELLLSSTRIVYSASENVVEDPAEVPTGAGGQITYNFLGNLRAVMAQVPCMENGCISLFLDSYSLAQLRNDINNRSRYTEQTSLDQLENMLSRMTGQDYGGRINGYKFRCQDFEVFSGTSFSNGVPGDPGVQLETLGGTSTITRTSFAVGANSIGFGVSMPMEIRTDPQDFMRLYSIGWFTHAEATGLDIDPDRILLPWEIERRPGAEEQLGVYQIRSSMSLI